MVAEIKFTVNEIFKKHFQEDAGLQINFGGSSSGKSYAIAQRCILEVFQGKRNWLCLRNVANTLKTSIYNQIYQILINIGLLPYFNINKSDLSFTCILNNKQIILKGLDKIEKLKSIIPIFGVIDTIWIEEATEIDYRDFKELQKRLRGLSEGKKYIILSFNPILKSHWIYKEFFQIRWNDIDTIYQSEELFILKTTYKDNKFLTLEDIKLLENETDKYYHKVYTLGEWGILGAVIFKNWKKQNLTALIPQFDNQRYGLDFGFAQDPLACVTSHYDKKRKIIYIFDEIYQIELLNCDLAPLLLEKVEKEGVIIADSAEPKSIAELNTYKIRIIGAKKGKGSINQGIKWLKQQTIIIHTACQNAINEFEKYKWKEDKYGNILPIPIDKNNHLIDALRYSYEDEFLKYDSSSVVEKVDNIPILPEWARL